MKKWLILICLLLCSSNLFAKHHHHHRGSHLYTGEVFISSEKVDKIKNVCTNWQELGYNAKDYVVYKDHELEFVYSECQHTSWEVEYIEIIRLANKSEINKCILTKILIIIGIIIFLVLVTLGQYVTDPYFKRSI